MDIDDILADVGRDSIPQETRDLQALTRVWVAERVSPEILAYPEALLDRTMERIRRQIEHVEMQTGNMDPKTNFRLIVVQTELERFKFLVRSFLRARIAKITRGVFLSCFSVGGERSCLSARRACQIDKHALHILTTPAVRERLSTPELQYLTQHHALQHAHFLSSFLRNFPAQLQRLDDTAGGISMIDSPDLDTAVFVRVLRDVEEPLVIAGTDASVVLKRGDVWVVRYSVVSELVAEGDVELI
ncbi:hypothetical protein FGG08_006797 [Glutinoglossum americanum]|uniref:DNA replication complex GINS protein SLD5 n=1 Tax=Glutinoglossum americanum TaxID=1670608 RepID=A0A9P8I0S6_9PEZI|nr:hypothetical protein FGG08_006797 [Glutinoglossum americanum]